MDRPQLILASTSPYRRAILQKLALKFNTKSPNIDEQPQPGESPTELVCRLAEQKARVIGEHSANALVIGSDQVAAFNQQIIGKPHSHQNAVKQLNQFSGQCVEFITGLTLYNSNSGHYQTVVDVFKVHFRQLTAAQIENYLNKEQPYDCAGSFKSEGLGIGLFERLEGDDPNSLIGLPLIKLVQLLANEGIDVFDN